MVEPGVIGPTRSVLTSRAPNAARTLRLAMSVKKSTTRTVQADAGGPARPLGPPTPRQQALVVLLNAAQGWSAPSASASSLGPRRTRTQP